MFARVITMLSLMPVFGSANVPLQMKVGLGFIVSLILFPLIPIHPLVQPIAWPTLVFLLFKEVAVGLLIGYCASLLFSAVQVAGRLIDTLMGFAFSEMVDPFTELEVTTMGQLKILLFTVFFLLINGHFFLLITIQKSFEMVPLMGMHFPSGKVAYFLTNMGAKVFVSGLQLCAPVYVALFMTYVALGIVARTVPQINVFFVGVPLQIAVGLIMMVLSLPILMQVFRRMFEGLILDIWKLLYLMA